MGTRGRRQSAAAAAGDEDAAGDVEGTPAGTGTGTAGVAASTAVGRKDLHRHQPCAKGDEYRHGVAKYIR